MISKKIIGGAVATLTSYVSASCNLWQTCASNEGKGPTDRLGVCLDPSSVTEPTFDYAYEPSVMASAGQADLASACPWIDQTQPLCCNQDNAQIMNFNYQQLDAVFGSDCPICAANLKRMWCDYACNADKAGWIVDGGEREATPPLTGMWRNVNTIIDSDYACGVFTSCAKESYISQSGISSAKAFLDFMGTNGAPFSLSWINFELKSEDSTELTAMQGEEDVDWYPCEYPVPANQTLNSYDVAYNTTCSYCDAACQPPVVDDNIAFLDGLSWKIVGYSYMSFVLFTIAFQVVLKFCCEKKQIDEIRAEVEAETVSSSATNGRPYTGQQRAQGRPLNVTDDHTNSRDVSGRLEDDR